MVSSARAPATSREHFVFATSSSTERALSRTAFSNRSKNRPQGGSALSRKGEERKHSNCGSRLIRCRASVEFPNGAKRQFETTRFRGSSCSRRALPCFACRHVRPICRGGLKGMHTMEPSAWTRSPRLAKPIEVLGWLGFLSFQTNHSSNQERPYTDP